MARSETRERATLMGLNGCESLDKAACSGRTVLTLHEITHSKNRCSKGIPVKNGLNLGG